MTTRLRWCLLAVAAALAAPASAHEVDCTKLAASALTGPNGGPILDPSGLPSLAAPAAGALTVDHYPALVAFDERIVNLATAPSVLLSVSDTLSADPSRLQSFGDALAGTIPLGGALHRVTTVLVRSWDDCTATFPQDPLRDAPVCGWNREDDLVVTTESDIAVCRARVVCAPQPIGPPPPPPPPPATCTAPSWTGDLALPTTGGAHAYADTVDCSGTTWLAGSYVNLLAPPTGSFGAVFRVDAAGQTSFFSFDEEAYAVRIDGAGHVDVAGHRTVGGVVGAGAAVRQFDQAGTLRWEYDVADFFVPPPNFGYGGPGIDADVDGSSNVVFAYRTMGTNGQLDVGVTKLAPDGTVVWSKKIGTTSFDLLGAVAVSRDGGIFVAGTTYGAFPGIPQVGQTDAFVVHLDAGGNVVWIRTLPSPTAGQSSDANAIAVSPDGTRIALGGERGAGQAQFGGPFVALLDGAGSPLWVHILDQVPVPPGGTPPPLFGTVNAVALDAAGAVWAGGTIQPGVIVGATTAFGETDGFVARLDAAGTYLWGRQYGGPLTDDITDIAIDAAGFGVASMTSRRSLNSFDVHAIRISPDGN